MAQMTRSRYLPSRYLKGRKQSTGPITIVVESHRVIAYNLQNKCVDKRSGICVEIFSSVKNTMAFPDGDFSQLTRKVVNGNTKSYNFRLI